MRTTGKQLIVLFFLVFCIIVTEVQGTRLRFVRGEHEEKEAEKEILESLQKYNVDMDMARTLVEYCAAVRSCDVISLKNFTCTTTKHSSCSYGASTYGLDVINVIDDKLKDMTVLVGANHKFNMIVVAFRGTTTVKNMVEDILLEKITYPLTATFKLKKIEVEKKLKRADISALVQKFSDNFSVTTIDDEFVEVTLNGSVIHSGFYSVWTSIEPVLMQSIEEAKQKYPHYRIVFTGYSLGGAIASLGATAMQLNGTYNVDFLYTFGEPKLGNNIFAEFSQYFLSPRRFRFVNNKDIIPHLPPWGLDYQHSGIEISLDRSGRVNRICDTYCEDASAHEDLSIFRHSVHAHYNYLNVQMHDTCGLNLAIL
jgi:predicted lipase